MAFPKRQITRAYRTARALFGKKKKYGGGYSRKRSAPKSYTDMYGRTQTKRRRMNSFNGKKSQKRSSYSTPAANISFKITHKKGVSYEKNERFDQTCTAGAAVVTSTTGTQGIWGRAFLQGQKTLPGGGVCGTSIQDMYDTYGAGMSVVRKIKGTRLNMQLLSASTGLMNVTIYIVRAARDTATGSNGVTSPVNAWIEAAANISGSRNPTIPGETPFVEAYGSYWRVVKTQKLIMNPGQACSMSITTDEHWSPSKTSLGVDVESNQYYNNIRNRTFGVLVVAQGYPVSDSVNPNLVSIGSAKVNITWDWRLDSSTCVHGQFDKSTIVNTHDPYATIAIAREMNDDSGIAANHSTA